ncbi:uncharacterized protein N7484_005284 [Penicillium longicatenatum]|uniref:uncharacterized protein n=1 Tax=Penicillium longicatenatum TaxID=1561947 RepID=UPI002546E0CA|nr:uncharacterized protein N7484_005284 [Penicillium longicatenatum]KAJ5651561.1 hypothetical protein N7484_005284 [Penicillium longicatenatum]
MMPTPSRRSAEAVSGDDSYETEVVLSAERLEPKDNPHLNGDLALDLRDQQVDDFQQSDQSQNIRTAVPEDLVNLTSDQGSTASTPAAAFDTDGPDCLVFLEENQSLGFQLSDSSTLEGLSQQSTHNAKRPPMASRENRSCFDKQFNPDSLLPCHESPLLAADGESEDFVTEPPAGVVEESAVGGQSKDLATENNIGFGQGTKEAVADASFENGGNQQSTEWDPEAASESARIASAVHQPSPIYGGDIVQQPCVRPETAATPRSASDSVSSDSPTSTSRKRVRRQPVMYDGDTTDGCDDPNDAVYMNGIQCTPRQSKKAPPTIQIGFRRSRRKSQHLSVNEPVQTTAVSNKVYSSNLADIETIPVRGFLTRQILLSKVVYSVTFEEQVEHICVNGVPDRAQARRANEDSHSHEKPRRQASRSTRSISEADRLLIELKEQQGLSWKEIAKRFPGRSQGSLQVRYSTRLKRRNEGSGPLRGRNDMARLDVGDQLIAIRRLPE